MSKRQKEIDDVINKLEDTLTDHDSLFLFILNGLEGMSSAALWTKNKGQLVGAICDCLESGQKIGADIIDLMSSVIINFAKAHPEFATQFIQCFNKIIYGLKDYDQEMPS